MIILLVKMADDNINATNSIVWIFSAISTFDRDLLTYICYWYFIYGGAVFCVLATGLTAPYGRYVHTSLARGTITLDSRFAWYIQELPALMIPLLIVMYGDCPKFSCLQNKIFMSFYLIHYVHRSLIYPFLMKSGKTMSVRVFGNALIFCSMNGYLQSSYLMYHAEFGKNSLSQINVLVGSAMFIFGLFTNIYSDHILRSLRSPGEINKYKIPRGGMFDYISGANFFGEIVEWAGFALATWSLPAAAFAFMTFSSLAPRAFHHHRYYKEKFEDYPKNRKALIPFIV